MQVTEDGFMAEFFIDIGNDSVGFAARSREKVVDWRADIYRLSSISSGLRGGERRVKYW